MIVDAVSQHIHHNYGKGFVVTARIPVIAMYAVYTLLVLDVKRYSGKTLLPLETHTSPDSRSKALGDIVVNNADGTCFEAIEIKHNKPITPDMVGVAYRKIKDSALNRYYILTTHEPNCDAYESVMQEITRYKKIHPCEIVINGVIPSLKYYLRLITNPASFIHEYTRWLEFEYQRASGIKQEHLRVWKDICQESLSPEKT